MQGKFFWHFEQPCDAAHERKPQSLRVAGKSQAMQVSAQRTGTTPKNEDVFSIFPLHSSNSSVTRGLRYEFICILGSLGPGIVPTIIMFSNL